MKLSTSRSDAQASRAPLYDEAEAQRIIESLAGLEGSMMPILHALQEAFGHVPLEAEPLIASTLNLSRADVHGVVSFYHDFRREPAGRHVLKLCRAEACQSMGGEENSRALLDRLGLDWGGTTADGRLTIEPIYCLGLCANAPNALLDGEPYGRLGSDDLEALVADAA